LIKGYLLTYLLTYLYKHTGYNKNERTTLHLVRTYRVPVSAVLLKLTTCQTDHSFYVPFYKRF